MTIALLKVKNQLTETVLSDRMNNTSNLITQAVEAIVTLQPAI
ncbi:hypothetical protein [Laspinema sp. D2d]|nr:hypothetical protein [Laspinema sp. D2d]